MTGSVADPGSGAILTHGSGIRNRFLRIPDLGSQTHIFGRLVTFCGVKSTIILCELAQIFFFTCSNIKQFSIFVIFVASKIGKKNLLFPLLFCFCCWIGDPGSRMDKNLDPG
jgi:hypothetical protein